MLVDSVTITIRAGRGGHGASTFRRTGQTAKGGPDGGNGGNGGDVYFQGSTNINDLKEFRYKKKIIAENGVDGQRKNLFGRNAEHTEVIVPVGTQITDLETNQIYEITDTTRKLLLAKGGIGGRGNYEFRTATDQAPTYAEKGTEGQAKKLYLNLRLIAEIGLIGLPNAGKSSLLSVLTNAKPEIGAYPFTTLNPNIGMMDTHAIADIPGLIEGASKGRGLGIKFLKHIEKTKILAHIIDITSPTPMKDYETVRKEFEQFSTELLTKPEIIVLNKIDLADKETAERVMALFTPLGKKILRTSVYLPETIEKLKNTLIV